MTKEQLILKLLQKTQQEANDQVLGEWLRQFVKTLDLGESKSNDTGRNLLLG